jgi:hypothetical protein
MALRIPTRLTAVELTEAAHLSRGWSYWPRRILGEIHAYAFLWVALFCLGAAMFRPKEFAKKDVLLGAMVCAAIGIALLFVSKGRRHLSIRRRLRKLNKNPGMALIDHEGVHLSQDDGSSQRISWSLHRRAIVGHVSAVLYGPKKFYILPISSLTDLERVEFVSILRTNLGPDKTREEH